MRPRIATPAHPPATFAAPEVFDVVSDPEAFLTIFDRTAELMRKGRVPRIDFSGTTVISTDAIVAMVAIATGQINRYGVEILISWDGAAPEIVDAFDNSGLVNFLRGKPPATKDTGMIRRRESHKVEPKVAHELIQFATQSLFKEYRREFGTYTAFIECMGNTFEHAFQDAEGRELWWASVHCNPKSGTAHCTFIDAGIGIFESILVKGVVKKMKMALRSMVSKPEILKELLERKIGSRTGESYRNRGLPKIYSDALAGRIRNLVIITDKVYADVEKGEFKLINRRFRGTFYHWEFTS